MHSLRTFPCISFFGPYFRSYISQYHLFLPLLCLTLLYSATPYLTLPYLALPHPSFPSPLPSPSFTYLPLPFLLLTSHLSPCLSYLSLPSLFPCLSLTSLSLSLSAVIHSPITVESLLSSSAVFEILNATTKTLLWRYVRLYIRTHGCMCVSK